MSVDEVEPIEAEAADENAVAPRGTHLASTQTVTHEYLTQSGKVMRETVKTARSRWCSISSMTSRASRSP